MRRSALVSLQPHATTNASLWLDEYLNDITDGERIRIHHLETLKEVRVPEGYADAYERRRVALGYLDGGFTGGTTRFFEMKLVGRMVVGIGAASVRETSIALLRPWGVPYVPGSALKGLASHVAHQAGGEWKRAEKPGEEAGALHRLIFGDVTGGGSVVFHDAWWQPQGDRLPILADTMTPHHTKYYTSGEAAAPLDTDEPNPVSFLTSAGTYLVALSGPPQAVEIAESFLRRGLDALGIGAKTAAGYGRATLEASRSPVARKIESLRGRPVTPGTVAQVANEIISIVRGTPETPWDREEVGAALRDVLARNARIWLEWLRKSERTQEEKQWFGAALEQGHLPERAERAERPPAPAHAQPAQTGGAVWRNAEAWAIVEKTRTFVIVRLDGKVEKEDVGKLTAAKPDAELIEELKAHGEATPLGVEVLAEVKNRVKLKGLRRRRG